MDANGTPASPRSITFENVTERQRGRVGLMILRDFSNSYSLLTHYESVFDAQSALAEGEFDGRLTLSCRIH